MDKESELEKMQLKVRQANEYQGVNVNVIKAEYENLLKAEREKYRLDLE